MAANFRLSARSVVIRDDALLLVEFDDETGLHFNLPGGGVEPGESLREAAAREAREETCAELKIGRLLWVVEYEPARNRSWAGPTPSISFIFETILRKNSRPRLPVTPDSNQKAVRWIPLAHLGEVELLPHISGLILDYASTGKTGPTLLEEPIDLKKAFKYFGE